MVKKVSFLGFFMFFLGTAFYCYEFFLQVAPATMTHELMHAFQANATQIGVISSAFFYSYTIFMVPAGFILDRLGARTVLTIATALCALGSLIFAIAPSIAIAAFSRFLMGLASTVAFIASLYLILRWFPARYFALMAGITQFMSAIGAIGGEAPLAFLVQTTGWRETMWILAFIGFGLAVITLLFLRNHPKSYNPKDGVITPSVMHTLSKVLKAPQMWWIALYAFAIWAPVTALASLWGVPFLKTSANLSTIQAAGAFSWTWVGIAVASPLAGWLSDLIGKRSILLTISALIGTISMVIFIYWTPHSIWLLWLLLFLLGVGAAGQTLIFAVVQDINPLEYTGTANGFINMAVVASGAAIQPFIGKMLDLHWDGAMAAGTPIYSIANYHTALLIIPILLLISTITSQFLIRETNCKRLYEET